MLMLYTQMLREGSMAKVNECIKTGLASKGPRLWPKEWFMGTNQGNLLPRKGYLRDNDCAPHSITGLLQRDSFVQNGTGWPSCKQIFFGGLTMRGPTHFLHSHLLLVSHLGIWPGPHANIKAWGLTITVFGGDFNENGWAMIEEEDEVDVLVRHCLSKTLSYAENSDPGSLGSAAMAGSPSSS